MCITEYCINVEGITSGIFWVVGLGFRRDFDNACVLLCHL